MALLQVAPVDSAFPHEHSPLLRPSLPTVLQEHPPFCQVPTQLTHLFFPYLLVKLPERYSVVGLFHRVLSHFEPSFFHSHVDTCEVLLFQHTVDLFVDTDELSETHLVFGLDLGRVGVGV